MFRVQSDLLNECFQFPNQICNLLHPDAPRRVRARLRTLSNSACRAGDAGRLLRPLKSK